MSADRETPSVATQLGALAYDAMTELLTPGRPTLDATVTFDIAGEAFALTVRRDLQDAGPEDFPTRKHEDAAMNARLVALADQVIPAYRAEGSRYSCTSHTAKRWQAAYDGAAAAIAGMFVLSSSNSAELAPDVRRLVIAARELLDAGIQGVEGRALLEAVEAFSSRVPYENEPDPHFDMVPQGDGRVLMTALDTWERSNEATFLRLMLEATNDVTEEQVAAWTDEQVKEADVWACSVHLNASDNDDVIVPPRPSFIPYQAHDPRRPLAPGEIRLGPGQLNYVDPAELVAAQRNADRLQNDDSSRGEVA